jgi:FkbM family methyltransferase
MTKPLSLTGGTLSSNRLVEGGPVARAVARLSIRWAAPGSAPPGGSPILELLHGVLVARGDPLVPFRHGSFDLDVPLSHRLPIYRALFPEYDLALGRLAAAVWKERPGCSMIDVGANVGDSAALLRSACPAPLLCIEPDERFFAILCRNAARLGGTVVPERVLVGKDASRVHGRLASSGGTARMVADRDAPPIPTLSLEEVLRRHPELPSPGLVKIDTDGHDATILSASGGLWARARPVIYFEYDPAFDPSWDPAPLWDLLAAAGYARILVYDNLGEFLLSLPISDRIALSDLHAFYSGRGNLRYADLCLFHADDAELADRFRRSEIAHFADARASRA